MKDPRHGNLYDLKPLALNDTIISAGEYTYYFRVCGKLSLDVCSAHDGSKAVSSCQEKKGPQGFQKVAGLLNQKLTFENGLLKMNYSGGDTCHKVYQRSTTIYFYCDRTTQKVSLYGTPIGSPVLHRLPHSSCCSLRASVRCTIS